MSQEMRKQREYDNIVNKNIEEKQRFDDISAYNKYQQRDQ